VRIADQVLASLDGFWGSHLIADPDTLRLLDEMSKSVRKHADGKIDDLSRMRKLAEKFPGAARPASSAICPGCERACIMPKLYERSNAKRGRANEAETNADPFQVVERRR